MSSPDHKRKDSKKEDEEDDDQGGGFMGKVKGFIHKAGDKIEDAVGFGKPTADVSGIRIPSVNMKTLELEVDVLIQNPNPVPIPLCDINYLVESEGRRLVSGLIPDAGTLHSHGSETVKVPLKLDFDDIKTTYKDIKEGTVIPYKVRVELIMDVPVINKKITFPLEKEGEIPIPQKPEVDLVKVKFRDFSFEETNADLHLKVINKNDFKMGLKALEYDVWLGDDNIGGAQLSKSADIDRNGEGLLHLPITFRPKDFGSALWDMLRGKGTGYSVKGSVEIDSVFGPMKLPFNKEGGKTKFKKEDDDSDDSDDEE